MTARPDAAHIRFMNRIPERLPAALPKLDSVITPTTWILAGLTIAVAILRPVFGG